MEIEIFAACLRSHISGKEAGEWYAIDLGTDTEELREMIAPEREQWAILDTKAPYTINKGAALEDIVSEAQAVLTACAKWGKNVVLAALSLFGSPAEACQALRNGQFHGVWESKRDWAEALLVDEEEANFEEMPWRYFDFDKYLNDCTNISFAQMENGHWAVFSCY